MSVGHKMCALLLYTNIVYLFIKKLQRASAVILVIRGIFPADSLTGFAKNCKFVKVVMPICLSWRRTVKPKITYEYKTHITKRIKFHFKQIQNNYHIIYIYINIFFVISLGT